MTKIIVSMTSWSKRIKQAETTVKSLLEQTRKPDLLELNLDLENFPHGIPDLPKWVMEFREKYPNFKVYFRGDDIKVYAKIMPTIGRHLYDDYILVTADDDVSYPPTYLEEIERNMKDADWLCTRSDQFTMGQYMVYSSKVCEKFIQHIDRNFMKNVPLDDLGLFWIMHKYGFKRGKKIESTCEDRQAGYSFRRFFVNVEDESKLKDITCEYPREEFKKECEYLAKRGIIPNYRKEANKGKSIVLAQDKFEFLGGTTTLLVDMATALLRIGGYDVYYWSGDMGTGSMTERWFESNGIHKYDGRSVDMAITCQTSTTSHFVGKCKVLQLLNSKYTTLEYPVKGCKAYIAVSLEVYDFMKEKFGLEAPVMLNGIDLQRFKPDDNKSETVRVLSICQGDDTLLREACEELGYKFNSVPKDVKDRVWNVEDLIKDSDIVVGIGRSAYVGMACGKCVVSWDNRSLNPNTGCGYIVPEKFFEYAYSNFTGRGYEPLDTKDKLVKELSKYNPSDGMKLRTIAEQHLNADINTRICLALLEGNTGINS